MREGKALIQAGDRRTGRKAGTQAITSPMSRCPYGTETPNLRVQLYNIEDGIRMDHHRYYQDYLFGNRSGSGFAREPVWGPAIVPTGDGPIFPGECVS